MSQDFTLIKKTIEEGKTVLGIEFGSTRIKAELIGADNSPIASGGFNWENRLENNIWTYSLEDIWTGLQTCYQKLALDVKQKYGIVLTQIGAIGFSGMMHGYLVFDKNDELLVPFRTWRNTMTKQASEELSELFQFSIPQRWSIAHLYQAILNKESHVDKIAYQTTLAGYIHWKLTGKKIMGIGEASGMFPVDSSTKTFHKRMCEQFDELVADKNLPWTISTILPEIQIAGSFGGTLTEEGAKLLDITGQLKEGCPICPPEGDVGTGMTATNSIARKTGNVSAGTSVFAMVVLENELSQMYPELDLVTTPLGDAVAMVHCNNCTSDLNAWVGIFKEFTDCIHVDMDMGLLYDTLYFKAMEGDFDCGGLLAYNYFSGEHITGFEQGRPLFVRTPDSKFNLANFMRVHLMTSLGALKTGLDILLKKEGVTVESITGHGGLFKTVNVGQSILAAAINAPVTVMKTAGEGGAFGIALLASYMLNKDKEETLEDFLAKKVFVEMERTTLQPEAEAVKGFEVFMERYSRGLAIEKAAVEYLS